jgi:hypothetical protein
VENSEGICEKMIHLSEQRVFEILNDNSFHDEIRELINEGHIKEGKDERTLQAYIWTRLIREITLKEVEKFYPHYTINVELYDKNKDTPDITIRKKNDYTDIFVAIEIKHHSGKSIGPTEWEKIYKDIKTLKSKNYGIFIMTRSELEDYDHEYLKIEEMTGIDTRVIYIDVLK